MAVGPRDVVHEAETRPRSERAEQPLDDFSFIGDRQRDLHDRQASTSRFDRAQRHVVTRAVGVVRDEDLVPRLELETPKHRRHSGRGVRNENKPSRIRVESASELASNAIELAFELVEHEADGRRSSRSRKALCAARTGFGHAPKEP